MDTEIEIPGFDFLSSRRCEVIAEAGVNHNNSVDRAIEMARRAADAGAWAIKFQLYKADSISVPASPKYWSDPFGSKTQHEAFRTSDKLDYGAYAEIAAACREFGIIFFATPFDLLAVDALEGMDTPLYKIASADITYRPLLEVVAATGKPILLSTGASELDEIQRALGWMNADPARVVPLVCTLTYPTPDRDGHFARVETLRRELAPHLVGVSDHTLGVAGGWMTAALGGVCIEKHYTLDKRMEDVPDHAMSVEPQELAQLVDACRRAAVLRGDPTIRVHESEEPGRLYARRSVVMARDVRHGAPIDEADLGFKRPGTGIPPYEVDRVIGRTALRDLPEGWILSAEDFS
jgi:N,N'-diacetyllegionaminate synthase